MIKFNGKDIVPRFNGQNVSRVMFNGKQIYPNNEIPEDNYPYTMEISILQNGDQTNFHSNWYSCGCTVTAKDGSTVPTGYVQCMYRWHGTDDPFEVLWNQLAENGTIGPFRQVAQHNKNLRVGDTYDLYFNYTVGSDDDIRASTINNPIMVYVIAD